MHPWFAPLHRRVLTLAVCLAWLGFEIWEGPGGEVWFFLALGSSAYAAMLLFRPPPVDPAKG